jgi:hypothetical protein
VVSSSEHEQIGLTEPLRPFPQGAGWEEKTVAKAMAPIKH